MTDYHFLPTHQKKELLSKLSHLMEKDHWTWVVADQLIRLGEATGKFDRVKIGSELLNSIDKDI
jgi:hypothetical protein